MKLWPMCPYPLQWKADSCIEIYGLVQDSMAEAQKGELKRGLKLLWVSLATFRRRSESEHGEGLISTNNEPVGRDYVENLQMVGKGCFLNWRNIAYGSICRFKEEDIKDFESPKFPFVGKARGITWYICFSSPEHPFFLLSWSCGEEGLVAYSQPCPIALSLLFSWVNPLIAFIIILSLTFPCDSYCPLDTIWQCLCLQGLLYLPSALLSTSFLLGSR